MGLSREHRTSNTRVQTAPGGLKKCVKRLPSPIGVKLQEVRDLKAAKLKEASEILECEVSLS